MSVKSVSAQQEPKRKKELSVLNVTCMAASAGLITDTALNVNAVREKSLLKSVQTIKSNIQPNSSDEFISSTDKLIGELERTIGESSKKSIPKKILSGLWSLVGFESNDTERAYSSLADYAKNLKDKVGDLTVLKQRVSEAGHQALESIVKTGSRIEGSSTKQVFLSLAHSYKVTGILAVAGLVAGIILKIASKDPEK